MRGRVLRLVLSHLWTFGWTTFDNLQIIVFFSRVNCPANGPRGRIWRRKNCRLMWLLARMLREIGGTVPQIKNETWNLRFAVLMFFLFNNAGKCYVWVSPFLSLEFLYCPTGTPIASNVEHCIAAWQESSVPLLCRILLEVYTRYK